MKTELNNISLPHITFFPLNFNYCSGNSKDNTSPLNKDSYRAFAITAATVICKGFYVLYCLSVATIQNALRCLTVVKRIIQQGATLPPGLSKNCMIEMLSNMYSKGMSRDLLNYTVDYLYLIKDSLTARRERAERWGYAIY